MYTISNRTKTELIASLKYLKGLKPEGTKALNAQRKAKILITKLNKSKEENK